MVLAFEIYKKFDFIGIHKTLQRYRRLILLVNREDTRIFPYIRSIITKTLYIFLFKNLHLIIICTFYSIRKKEKEKIVRIHEIQRKLHSLPAVLKSQIIYQIR